MMIIFNILGCIALLFSAFGLYDTMTNLTDWSCTKLQNYKYKINFDVELTVLENNDYIKLAKNLNSFKSLKQGIVLSKKTADKLDLEVGDIVSLAGKGS